MTITYDTLRDAVNAMKLQVNTLIADIDWNGDLNEAYNQHIRYIETSWALIHLEEIAVTFESNVSWLYDYLSEKYEDVQESDLPRLAWSIGKNLLINTPIVLYYQGGYDELSTEFANNFVNDNLVLWTIDNEYNFGRFLNTYYGYDTYRQILELDLAIEFCRDTYDVLRRIDVDYTVDDEYNFIDFLSDAVQLILSPIIAAAQVVFATTWSMAISIALFTFVVIPAFEATALTLGATFAVQGTQVVDVATAQYLNVTTFSQALSLEFSTFLEVIHWETLVKAHEISLIVSEDYREVWRDVELEIAKVSEAIGVGPYYMSLFLRNTRTLVLDVSTTLGMKYDLAQIQWLSVFNEYSALLSARAFRYRDDPSLIISDMEELVDRKLSNGKGSFMETVIGTVDSALVGIESLAINLSTIRDDIDRLTLQLPENMSAYVQQYTDPIIERFDGFMNDTYRPTIEQLTSLVNVLEVSKTGLRNDLDGIVARLKKPADYILEIDKMTEKDRLDQETKLQDVVTRPYTQTTEDIQTTSTPTAQELESIAELLEQEIEKPSWEIKEVKTPSRPAGVKASPRETWNVGEY